MSEIYRRIADLKAAGKTFAVATLLAAEGSTPRKAGARMIVYPDGTIEDTIGGGAVEKRIIDDAKAGFATGETVKLSYDLGSGEPADKPTGMICGGWVEILLEFFCGEQKLIICGGGHIAAQLAALCPVVDMPFVVVDNREMFASTERFPAAREVIHADYTEAFDQLRIDRKTAIVIVTHGHANDDICLEKALATDAFYIGMIGSRTKVKTVLENLAGKNCDVQDPRLYAPIGLDLGDETPAEIALAILAEIIKVRENRTGQSMRDR